MTKKQFKEGELEGCLGAKCNSCCCDDGLVEEWIIEYMAFHDRMKDFLISHGIKIKFIDDRVKYSNCSNGKECKFLKYSLNKEIDLRPIDCKIYPFLVDWNTIDFDKKIVNLYYWGNECPMVKNKTISKEFKNKVEEIIKSNFAFLFHSASFNVVFMNKVFKKHRFYKFSIKTAK
ncbi:MAG: hypothetical protein Q7T79_01105 [bacterium]|nr:hypothetical protein [bacterium]